METVAQEISVWELLATDEDVVEDLRALGVNIHEPESAESLDQTRRDAMASVLMRRQAAEMEAIGQLEQSRDAEIRFIAHRYAPELERRRLQVARLEEAVKAIAWQTKERNGYTGKKKSRDVGAGTYGYRTSSAGVELADEAAFIAWAEEHAPETLRVKPTLTLAVAREYLSETELAAVRREVIKKDACAIAAAREDLPAGFVAVAESHDYFAKPLPAAALPGPR